MITASVAAVALALTFWLAIKFPRHAALLLAFILPSYLIRLAIGPVPTTYLELSVWVVTLGLLINPSSRHSLVTFIKALPKPFIYAAIGFLVAASISTIISPHLHTSLGIFKGWVITPMLAGVVVASAMRSKKDIQSIIFTLIASGTAMAAYAILTFQPGSRLVGVYDVPNSLALFIAPLLTASLWQLLTQKAGLPAGKAEKKYLLVCASVIMGAALLGTQSLGGIVSVLATLLILSIVYVPRQQKKRSLIAILACTLIAGATLWQTGKLQYLAAPFLHPDKTNSVSVRLQLWSVGWDLIKEHPTLGIGLGQFEPAYQQKLHERFQNYLPASGGQPVPEFVFRDPHNWILSFWLNTGILGLISFVTLNFLILKNATKERDQLRVTHSVPLSFSGVGLLFTILIFGLADTIYWKNDLAIMYWVLLTLPMLPTRVYL